MTKRLSLILGLSAALSVGALACSETEENSEIECTSDADCAGNTDGKTTCDTANKVCVAPVATGCTSDADCAGNTDGKTSCNTNTGACVVPANGGCVANEDCASGLCDNSVCATSKLVNCTDPQVENATANTESMVQVTFDAATNTWSEAASCPWLCNYGYDKNEEGTACVELPRCDDNEDCNSKLCEEGYCQTQKTDACKAYSETELAELNATGQDTTAQVTWNYIEDGQGNANWVAESGCPLTGCAEGYDYQEVTNTCEAEVTVCSSNADCADNGTKTWCEVPDGQNEGVCIAPECQTSAQCTDETKPYCDPNTFKCTATCLTDEQCVDIHGEGMICNWDTTTENSYTCVEAQCTVGECDSNDLTKQCKGGRWEPCRTGQQCLTEGSEQLQGSCQIVTSSNCDPACEDNQFCRDNGESAGENRYTCEWNASQLSEPTIRISQFYFGGYSNSTTATYTNGFLEIYNYGNAVVDLTKLAILKGTREGSFSMWMNFAEACVDQSKEANCQLASKSYFRIKNMNNSVSTSTNPTVISLTNNDLEISDNVSIDGSLAVVTWNNNNTAGALSCNEVKEIATDLIGMGSAYCSESRTANGISGTYNNEGNRGTHSYQRDSGLNDTGDNYTDFEVKPVAPGKPL